MLSSGDLERMRLSDKAHAENDYEDASLAALDRRDLLAELDRLHKRWRPEVVAFADLMEERLRRHDGSRGPRGWENCDPQWLLGRLKQEVAGLEKALKAPKAVRCGCREAMCPHLVFDVTDGVGAEAADVANFAMMIADVREELDR